MYKPLTDNLTIKKSDINGLGLFAQNDLKIGKILGITHIKIGETIIRTPLGGFINHSDNPTCSKRIMNSSIKDDLTDYQKWYLVVDKDIKVGTELTVKYTFYNANANAKAKLIAGEALTEAEADTIVI